MGTFELRILSIGLRKICQSIPGTKRESKVKMAGLPVDYYAALGIPSSASQQQIRDAYKRAALKTHPDRVASDSPERAERTRKFQLINDAYYTLSDPKAKNKEEEQKFGNEQFGDVFEEMLRDAKGKSVYAVFQELPQDAKGKL